MSATISAPPDVSVIIPAHNRPDYLPACIASILEQDWRGRLEIIVVDDGSTTDPFAALPKDLPDTVRLFRKANEGVSATRRYGFAEAKGRYIAFNDDDDLWMPGRLQKQLDFMESHPEIDMIFGDLIEFTDHGDAPETHFAERLGILERHGRRIADTDLPVWRFERGSLSGPFLTTIPLFFQTVLARRELIERIGSMHPTLRSAAECTDFALRTGFHGSLAYLHEPTFRLRRGHQHETGDAGWLERDLREFFAIYPDYPAELRRLIDPHLGSLLATRGWFHFKRGRYRAAAGAYRDAAQRGPIGGKARLKWGLALLLGLFERERQTSEMPPGMDDKDKTHASTG